ncbi:putative phospholipid:lipid A palmitoyltransferase PagP [Campylobacter avium LMG 24591]|uniref:Putative phospholipid:lipid A palmitoyltransferase PagP n=1 Tax=Campylobacter avium LMG 24591 TaxID=522484 RepID=A0A222MYY0_9BACT|nr:phospholipid:lipid A palmitoyltransferase [Campylobacter avium]ASQ30806.1 putative phospholipid:lipid A palmitoyltransferase PagP [Campylobacter avium LMG 24591]OYD78618.1 putative phospholipid:lipid A palmitoyltransferase PagP [Campylobacter avium]HJE66520.1 hypothetical protein [Campylobacter avium]
MHKSLLYFFLCIFCFAKDFNIVDYFHGQFKDIYHNGSHGIIVPLNTWHNRLAYDDEHISRYNEMPWGLGYARLVQNDKEQYGLYAVVFEDSNYHMQSMFGYIHSYFLNDHKIKFSLGYTVGFVQRHEYYYVPIPLPLPVIGINLDRLSIQSAYIPGFKNFGNVAFTYISFRF